jgi:hypothetical protein
MSDPNADYKRAYSELSQSLGRQPTVAEVMPLMETLRQAWINMPAREEEGRQERRRAREVAPVPVLAPVPVSPDRALTNPETDETAREAGSAAPSITGPSSPSEPVIWQLCPECGFERDPFSGTHRSVSPTTTDCARLYPLVGAATTEPMIGSRGPRGGMYARCEECARVWERPKKRGRPSYRCDDCR